MTARALVLQHQHNAPPALLADWAAAREVGLEVVRADTADALPGPDRFDCAIALGSDHSAGAGSPAWVARELDWLRLAHAAALPVLGICFGAQALAVALGGAVGRAQQLEIGWVYVQSDAVDLVEPGPWFTWHEDVIVLPPGATEIARNAVGPQAFVAGASLGVQFHPEVTPDVTAVWAARPRGVSQLAHAGLQLERLVHQGRRNGPRARAAAFRLFDAFLARTGAVIPRHPAGEPA